MGEAIHLSDLKIPASVEIASLLHGGDAMQPVVSVHAPRVEVEIEDEVEAGDAPEVAGEEAEGDAGDGE